MANKIRRISKEMDEVLVDFQKIAERKLNTRVPLIKATRILSEALRELDLENVYLKKRRLNRRRVKKQKLDRIEFELRI